MKVIKRDKRCTFADKAERYTFLLYESYEGIIVVSWHHTRLMEKDILRCW